MAVVHLSSSVFLNAVTPEVVIISLGAGNSYGHPHQEALGRILAAGSKDVFRTDVDGTITFTTNGSSGYSLVTENTGRIVHVPKFEMVCCLPTIALIFVVAYIES